MQIRRNRQVACAVFALAATLSAPGCKREQTTVVPSVTPTLSVSQADVPAAPTHAAPLELKDIVEHNPNYVIGMTFPAAINHYPGLAEAANRYAQRARGELMQAVEGIGHDRARTPYELSLQFDVLLERPDLVALAADGSRYTGGPHGEPLLARFVWLPQRQRMLTAEELIPDADHWKDVATYVAAHLRHAMRARGHAAQLTPDDRDQQVLNADKMIAEGTTPQARNFSQFQPLVDARGKITAVRFVFPSYQVGAYSDGTQIVDVPASVLRALVAPQYAGLFVA